LPLFQFATTANIDRGEIGYSNSRHNLHQERLGTENGVRAAVIDLTAAYGNLRVAEQTLDMRRERVDLQEQRLGAGVQVSFIELEMLRDQLAQAERGVLNARIYFQTQLLELGRLVGREVRP
jgi:outer membrane protein TolC